MPLARQKSEYRRQKSERRAASASDPCLLSSALRFDQRFARHLFGLLHPDEIQKCGRDIGEAAPAQLDVSRCRWIDDDDWHIAKRMRRVRHPGLLIFHQLDVTV